MSLCLPLHCLKQFHIDFLKAQPLKISVQQKIQFYNFLFLNKLIHSQNLVLDDVAFQHHHRQNLFFIHPCQLDKLELVLLALGCCDQRSIIRIRCQQLHHLFQNLFELVDLLNHHLILSHNLFGLNLHQIVNIETIALIRRNTSG